MSLQATIIEKLKFFLPAVFTIGPQDDIDSMSKYAVLLTGNSDGSSTAMKGVVSTGRNHVQEIVKGIIEGETRSIVSTMTMEELFKGRRSFKTKVLDNVQVELNQFGLKIYNANADVAHARMTGEIGEAKKQGRNKQERAKINANTAVLETERKSEKAAADSRLKTKEIRVEKELQLERIMAQRIAEQRDMELQKIVEQKRAEMELERLRTNTVTQVKISRESAQQKADADLCTQTKLADGKKYNQQADSEAKFYQDQGRREDPTAPIRNLFQSLPPLLTTIREQIGISPPSGLQGCAEEGTNVQATSSLCCKGEHTVTPSRLWPLSLALACTTRYGFHGGQNASAMKT
ncbi:hypothetical protein BJ546DRAFT_1023120 [Cryomyces antarcticus]